MLEYVLSLAALLVVILLLGGLVMVARHQMVRVESLTAQDVP